MAPDSDDTDPDGTDGTDGPDVAQPGQPLRRWGGIVSDGVYRARAADHRKPTDYVQLKLRVRASLVKRLQKEADKKKQSANNEAVERLERTFAGEVQASRDTETLNLMLGLVTRNPEMKTVLAVIINEIGKLDLSDLGRVDSREIGDRVRLAFKSAATPYDPMKGSV
jgi:hypothetical protein